MFEVYFSLSVVYEGEGMEMGKSLCYLDKCGKSILMKSLRQINDFFIYFAI